MQVRADDSLSRVHHTKRMHCKPPRYHASRLHDESMCFDREKVGETEWQFWWGRHAIWLQDVRLGGTHALLLAGTSAPTHIICIFSILCCSYDPSCCCCCSLVDVEGCSWRPHYMGNAQAHVRAHEEACTRLHMGVRMCVVVRIRPSEWTHMRL